ncbi:MAG: hypothetical protein ACI9UR_001044, partial [Bacteroidia bacterium]
MRMGLKKHHNHQPKALTEIVDYQSPVSTFLHRGCLLSQHVKVHFYVLSHLVYVAFLWVPLVSCVSKNGVEGFLNSFLRQSSPYPAKGIFFGACIAIAIHDFENLGCC